MKTRIKNAPLHHKERQYPRFPLDYPVHLKIRGDGPWQELEAVSKNISRGGLLLKAASPIPPIYDVEFVMTIQTNQLHKPIRLKGVGRVVRIEHELSRSGVAIAIQCKPPISLPKHVRSPRLTTRPQALTGRRAV